MRRENKHFEGIIVRRLFQEKTDGALRKHLSEEFNRGTLQGRGEGENQQRMDKPWDWQSQEAVGARREHSVTLAPKELESWNRVT